mgnify:FL=1|jgi:integrase
MKYSLIFLLETKNNRPDEERIRMRVRWNGKQSQHFVPYTVNPKKWSKETRRCIPNTTHGKHKISASVINAEIQKYENTVRELLKQDLSLEEFKKQFNFLVGKVEHLETATLFDILDLFIKQASKDNTWSERTKKHFESLKNHLFHYNPNLTMNLTEEDLQGFMIYLQSKESVQKRYKNATKGISNRTASNYLSKMRWFLKWAKTKKHYSGDLHETFHPNLKGASDKRKVIFLTWKELIKLYEFIFEDPELDIVRDVFCFCCFTSLRFSDVENLKKENIYENHISVVTQKTHEDLRIDMNNYSRAILGKYKDYNSEFAMPVPSNVKMNKLLKEIGKILEFNEQVTMVNFIGSKRIEKTYYKYELLTTHCGRRTFIVNAIFLGIPTEVVMKWTGHEDFESMKPYLEIVDDLRITEMEKFNSPTLPNVGPK